MNFVDTHIHLSHFLYEYNFPCCEPPESNPRVTYQTRESLIEKMKNLNIKYCIDPAIGIDTNSRIIEFCEKYPDFIFGAVGVHPKRAADTDPDKFTLVEELSLNPCVVAIGEAGLDYSYEGFENDISIQKEFFVRQIELAHIRKLPLVLHIRDAFSDGNDILYSYRDKLHGGVAHCFNGNSEEARFLVEKLDLSIGIGASIFLDEREELRTAVKNTPLDHILLETDGPYVRMPFCENLLSESPDSDECVPLSKKKWKKARNSSVIIPTIAQEIAFLHNISVEEVAQVTSENADKIFRQSRA